MDLKQWSAILSRIGPHDADDLDELLAHLRPAPKAPGRDIFPLPEAVLMPQTALRRADAVCVGVRAAAADASAFDRAMRLAAFAIERDVQIVVLERGRPQRPRALRLPRGTDLGRQPRGTSRLRGPDPPVLEPGPGALTGPGVQRRVA